MSLLSAICIASTVGVSWGGQYFNGTGTGDAAEWLAALNMARAQFEPNPDMQV